MKTALAVILATLTTTSFVAGASAGGFARATTSIIVNGGYRATVDEYRDNVTLPRSLACPRTWWSSAPIMIAFGGGDGTGNVSDGFVDLGRKLNLVCVRLVVVEGLTGYASNARAASISSAPYRLGDFAANMRFATNVVLTSIYPGALTASYLGGSMSAALGAKMFESEFYRIIAAPSTDRWSRLDRFILGGPPLGNIHAGCRYALDDPRSYMPAIVSTFAGASSCAAYLAQSTSALGAMYGTSTATQRTQLQRSGVRVNFFIGSADEFFGWRNDATTLAACALTPGKACATGPSGVRNYLDVAGLRGMTVENVGGSTPLSPTLTSTLTTMPGRMHSTLWDAETSTLVCRLASFDANNIVNDWRCSN